MKCLLNSCGSRAPTPSTLTLFGSISMTIYRKIYETFYGQIPKDQDGRSYDIHHIDGDKTNNSILNLVALSIQDHYDVHYIQGDYGACYKIGQRLLLTPEEISELGRNIANKRILENTHPWQNKEKQRERAIARVKNGTCPFLNPEIGRKGSQVQIDKETHPFLGGKIQKETQLALIKNGKHHFLGSSLNDKMLKDGIHPSQRKKTCPKCNKTMSNANYIKWKHGDKCDR
jgi:HNH endonuclease